jgi:hypothetical protein
LFTIAQVLPLAHGSGVKSSNGISRLASTALVAPSTKVETRNARNVSILTHESRLRSRDLARLAGPHNSSYRYGMKLKGMLTRTDVEGGHWLLKTEDGDQYQLQGDLSACKDGARVEVEGKVDREAMGFGMLGPQFTVNKMKTI